MNIPRLPKTKNTLTFIIKTKTICNSHIALCESVYYFTDYLGKKNMCFKSSSYFKLNKYHYLIVEIKIQLDNL